MYTWSSIHDYETTSGLGNDLLRRLRGKQIIEVGPGLAELTPTIALSNEYPPPIIIEPVNLFDIQQILQSGIDNPGFALHKEMLTVLLNRVLVLTSPKVRWIREKIENIPQTHPELAHQADTVIDIKAGTIYGENFFQVYAIEHEFLQKK